MGESQINPDPDIDKSLQGQSQDSFLSEIVIPIMFEGYAARVIAVKSRLPDAFSNQDRKFLEIIGFFLTAYSHSINKKRIEKK